MYRKEYALKNGIRVLIREVQTIDAKALSAYKNTLLKEKGFKVDDNAITPEKELKHILAINQNEKLIYLVATTLRGEVVGHATLKLRDDIKITAGRNDVIFGILKNYCGVELINHLAKSLVDCANDLEFIQKERRRAEESTKLQCARQQFNFETLDRINNAMSYIVGKFADEIYMRQFYRTSF